MTLTKILSASALGLSLSLGAGSFAVAASDMQSKQSVGEYASDAVVTTKVKAAMVAEKDLSALDVAAETNNGVVTLTGTVATAAQAEAAARVTRGVEGVKQVENKLKVDPAKRS